MRNIANKYLKYIRETISKEDREKMKIGIIGFQGAVTEHIEAVEEAMSKKSIKGETILAKQKSQINKLDGLIIPGGESTTISRLMKSAEIFDRIKKLDDGEFPIMGTCAGLILLAKRGGEKIKKANQPLLRLMDIKVKRNAFGSQKNSFEKYLNISKIGNEPFKGVFIRAPAIVETGNEVDDLAKYKDKIIAAEQNNLLALAFHPELTSDTRFHEYFLEIVKS